MGRFDRNEVIAALAFMAFGLFWVVVGMGYSWGSSVRIGAAVFPVALGVIMIALCGVILGQSRQAEARRIGLKVRPAILILGGILVWALSVDHIGFLPATAILVALCSLAERESTWRSILGLTVFLCAFGTLVFITALRIPLSVLGG
ncbi:tripartite tricarboxylate transporter TctB family protein [Oceanibium sediminis]|uniref:tripartite tricarboxylate transporter TctB family protein n=1 Tax=Oceanibium sediminis TaxID=2026339 RepID=UPI0013006289|nr:tripartite tricarboxylate transporter TctB family protein [Oceanibium sediminis]